MQNACNNTPKQYLCKDDIE